MLNQQKVSSKMHYFRAPTAAKSISSAATTKSQEIRITVLQNKSTNKVAYAEAGEDFLDLIFSFLVLPLGLVIKLLAGSSSIGCIDNLYHSIDELSVCYECIKSEECKSALMSPKLRPHFSVEKGLLNVEEAPAQVLTFISCEGCCKKGSSDPQDKAKNLCSKSNKCTETVALTVVNPKRSILSEEIAQKPLTTAESGGGYVKGPMRFLVSDNLGVMPFCSIDGLDAVRDSKGNIDDLEVVKVNVGPGEVMFRFFFTLLCSCNYC